MKCFSAALDDVARLAPDPGAAVQEPRPRLELEDPLLPAVGVQRARLLLLEEVTVLAAEIALIGDVDRDERPLRKAVHEEVELRDQVMREEWLHFVPRGSDRVRQDFSSARVRAEV
jgi:hypothetical protein